MKWLRHITTLLLAMTACSAVAGAQTRNLPARGFLTTSGSAQGELTVTLTIVTSVGVVLDENGQPKLIVANAPDPADNVSALNVVHGVSATQPGEKPKNKKQK